MSGGKAETYSQTVQNNKIRTSNRLSKKYWRTNLDDYIIKLEHSTEGNISTK